MLTLKFNARKAYFLKKPLGLYKLFNHQSHQWTSKTIRSSFVSFFEKYDHLYIPSSPVVPWGDTSLEFVNAGMNQFKSCLLGRKESPAGRAVNSQKCIRVGGKHNDLSDVGRDSYHHTFFEMLGNWSFKNYFKEEACQMSWELLTKVFHIPPQHLYVTYFGGEKSLGLKADDETKNIWASIGVPSERIIPFGMKENFWEMGSVGPCGPSTEIHFERQPSLQGALKVNAGSEDLIEIWNIVFIQFNRVEDSQLIPLESYFVDTGMGLERITACLNAKRSNYDTDLFRPLFNKITKLSRKPEYKGSFTDDLDTYYRILADHSRMISCVLADGLLPHDCYSLRRAIRRSLQIGWDYFQLDSCKNFMSNLVSEVTENLGDTYPELKQNFERSLRLLEYEELLLKETRMHISREWPKLLEMNSNLSNLANVSSRVVEALQYLLPNIPNFMNKTLPCKEAVKLVESYSISPESVNDIAETLELKLNSEDFIKMLQEKTNKFDHYSVGTDNLLNYSVLSKLMSEKLIPKTDDSFKYNYSFTPENGYHIPTHSSKLESIISKSDFVNKLNEGDEGIFILKSTNFYPTSGGQYYDRGLIKNNENAFKVTKVEKVGDYVFHFGVVVEGEFFNGMGVNLQLDKGQRLGSARLHTAHHLLRAAIESVAGMAFQRSSLVTDKSLTMDVFVHPPLDVEQLFLAEKIVKVWINSKEEVTRQTMPLSEALKISNLTLLSGEKYPEEVHVISSKLHLPPDFSLLRDSDDSTITSFQTSELCCGTHIFNTGHLESFAITNFKPLVKGISRISAIFGKEASKLSKNSDIHLKELDLWDEKIRSAIKNNERLMELNKNFKKWKTQLKKSEISAAGFHLIEKRSKLLVEAMEEILITKSNWKELHSEFLEVLSNNPKGVIMHDMQTEYRGPLENLETIIKEASGRPAVFVCKGWGRVRACISIPKEIQNGGIIMDALLDEIKKNVGKGETKVETQSSEIGFFFANGVKRDQVNQLKETILKTCSNYIGKLHR